MGLDSASAGVIGSFAYIGMLVGALVGGPACDRFGRRRFVNLAVGWFTLWTFACGLAAQPWQLGGARLLAGLGMGAVIPASVALAREFTPANRGALTVTILMAGVPLGGMTASLVGLLMLPAHGWRVMFLIGGLISVVILAAALPRLPESEVSTRWGNRRVAVGAALLVSAGTLACAIGSEHQLALLAYIAVIGAGAQSALNLVLASVADTYPARMRATALGWANGVGRSGAVVAPALGGAILAAGLGPRAVLLTFSLTALCAAAVIAVLVLLGRRPEYAERPDNAGDPVDAPALHPGRAR